VTASADARYVASVLLTCFTGLSATLTATLATGLLEWSVPIVLGVLTLAHGFDQGSPVVEEVAEE